MDMLGIPKEQLFVYDYQVRMLSYHRQEVLEELVKLRQQIKPDLVLVPSGSDLHQDHQVVHNEGLRHFKQVSIWGYELLGITLALTHRRLYHLNSDIWT